LPKEERSAVQYLRESGMPFRRIVWQLNFYPSNALYFYNKFVSSGSIEKKTRTGRSIKISAWVERIVCAAKSLDLNFKRIVKDVRQFDVCNTAIKYIIRKIVHKYKFLSFRRKGKPFISANNYLIRLWWVREHSKVVIYD